MLVSKRFSLLIIKTTICLLLVGHTNNIFAKKGMWLPPLIKSQEAQMKSMGLEIPIEKLYNTDGTGLNNAVVLFGSGCTGEIISSKGLLLTNHHCGYGTVQGLSSKEKDYFAKGFWAMNNGEELPCPGLTVTFIRKMENVTDQITTGIPDTLDEKTRAHIIDTRIKQLEKGYQYATKYDAVIKPYYNGNQYWVILSEKFKDIRLVGFPPNGIGTFGGDTDNWMWPRHTGDFSIFRVYANKDNQPAEFSEDNKPYSPKAFFNINASGYKEGDFTMVYGFPGRTMQYISSYQLDHVYSTIDPTRIEVRTALLNTWDKHMKASREVFLKYTSKYKRTSNGWKKWQGEVRGLKINNVVAKKEKEEGIFQNNASGNSTLPYAENLLPKIGGLSIAVTDKLKTDIYIREAAYGVELIRRGAALEKILDIYESGAKGDELKKKLRNAVNGWNGFFKNYDVATDKDVFKTLMPIFMSNCKAYVPKVEAELNRFSNNYDSWANYVYKSIATSPQKLATVVDDTDGSIIKNDPAYKLYKMIATARSESITPTISTYYERMKYLNRLYMKAQMTFDQQTDFFPDANLTLRLAYGKMKGIDPDGPAGYSYVTNLDEAVAKHNPDVEEFDMPEKLRDIHAKKDYGRWGVDGTVPSCFIATNHTTGGNSGSPVLNSKGELIGTNFDRIWEGTMSDLYFDPNLCRNISVDIRYTLFIIDKFGGADWLLDEMNITQ